MDPEKLILIISLLSKGLELANELNRIAQRALAGEEITDAELDAAKAKMEAAVENFKNSTVPKPSTEPLAPADG